MRRDELVDGAWYSIRYDDGSAECSKYIKPFFEFTGQCGNSTYFAYPEYLVKRNAEWARINPEEIFNAVPLNPQDGGMGCYGSVRHSQRMSVERALDKMSEKERLIVFYKYCDCCGVKQDPENPECKCWNNE